MLARISKACLPLCLGFLIVAVSFRSAQSAQPPRPNQQQIQQQIQQLQQQAQQQQQQMQQYIQQLQQAQQQRMQQAQQQAQRQAQVAGQQAQRQAQQLQRQAQQAQRQAQNGPRPQLQDVTTTYEFIIADEGVVRTMALLSPELDDKGRPKKLDAEEKKKLKGDSEAERKFPGYKATVEDLQVGDEIVVTLSRNRPVKGSKKKDADGDEDMPKMKGKAKEKDEEKAADDEEKPKAKAKGKAKAKEEKEDGDEKPKAKAKEKEDGDEEKEAKKIDLSMWRPVGKLMGTISEADTAGSRRIVIRITQKQWVMVGGNGQRQQQQPQGGGAGGGQNNHISIDPSQLQATLVQITKRGTGVDTGGGGDTGFGFGK